MYVCMYTTFVNIREAEFWPHTQFNKEFHSMCILELGGIPRLSKNCRPDHLIYKLEKIGNRKDFDTR